MTDRVVTLRDGRGLGITALGDPASRRLVVFCHPAPGAGGFDPDPVATSESGVHVVSVDRPGYGASTALADEVRPTIGQRADDIADYLAPAIQDAKLTGSTPLDRIGVVGWSAGGRVALALAARHPGLVDRVAVVATPAPDSAVRWVPEEFAALNAELVRMPPAAAKARLRPMLEAQVPDGVAGVELLTSGDTDRVTLERPGLGARLERMLGQAYRQGTVGVTDDLLSYIGDDWDFDLARVRAPVLLVYGARDRVVTSKHGRWYRRRLPHARLTVVPRTGHLVVAEAWDRILAHVDPFGGGASDGGRPD